VTAPSIAGLDPSRRATILEIGDDPAVGFACHILACSGHRVIKIELLPDGDYARDVPPFYKTPGSLRAAGVLFHYLHRGKESVAIDPAAEEACTVVARLAGAVDAVVTGNGGSLVALARDALAATRPSVVTTISPFGASGPRAHHAAVAGTVFASSGEASMLPGGLGYALNPGAPPLLAPGHVADFDAGVIAALVTLAGLWNGQALTQTVEFDVSKQECETSLNRWLVSHYRASGWIESRATRAYAYGGLVECADGFVMFQPTTDGHWAGLKAMLGHPDWAEDANLATQEGRVTAGALIQEKCWEWAAARTKAEIFAAGLECGVPIAPFRDMSEVAACTQFASRDFFVPYGPERLPGLPFGPAFTVSTPTASAPDLGEHTASVLEELLDHANPQATAVGAQTAKDRA
jgi:crotonobetainyl-CoA:carnitine CoA-transferase CaiB-like acyl-CoA transferase